MLKLLIILLIVWYGICRPMLIFSRIIKRPDVGAYDIYRANVMLRLVPIGMFMIFLIWLFF